MKFVRCALIVFAILALSTGAFADNLYRVSVQSQSDADLLTHLGVDPIVRLTDGYLVLLDAASAPKLETSGLPYELLASKVNRSELAIDGRLDRANVGVAPLLFDEDNTRLFLISRAELNAMTERPQLFPVDDRAPVITFKEPRAERSRAIRGVEDLNTLVGLLEQDSLQAWDEHLESYAPRVQGSAANYAARDWLTAKFSSFGYDSVVVDSFLYSGTQCANVYAVKVGDRFPDHQVVVGAHFDAVSSSPGADDNGSGAVAVLEMARILSSYETDMTFVFVCFDAEESGLNGSEHYADAAFANGDNIICMLNMDMIAWWENTTDEAKIYHGSDTRFAQLWIDLADSLLGMTGYLWGTASNSDHASFAANGWDVLFTHEYEFCDYYHSYRDSTSYMSFPYHAQMARATLATAYYISQTEGPLPAVAFTYPGGVPQVLTPGAPTTFEVEVGSLYDGIPVSGSGQLRYSVDGGTWATVAMTETSPNLYEASLPGGDCYQKYQFYVSAEEQSEGRYDGATYEGIVATQMAVPFEDDFETDLGWTAEGQWQRGTPTGQGGDHGNADPSSAYGGVNEYGYNLNGDYSADMDETHLTSPAIDCSSLVGTHVSFQRWLGVERPQYDHAYLRVSINGTSWTIVWENDDYVEDAAWQAVDYDMSALVDGQSTVYIRFTMGETDGSWQYCGWNIDDFAVYGFSCGAAPDGDSDGIPDASDNCRFVYNPNQEDADGDLIGDVCDECTDTDDDGYGDPGFAANTCAVDNCPDHYNPSQADGNSDGVGDACCCMSPTVGDLDQSGEAVPENVNGIDLSILLDGLFISLDWSGVCMQEADMDGSGLPEPHDDDVDGIDLSMMLDALFISLDPLPACP